LDGIKVLEKTDPSPAPLQIALPPSSSERVLTILIRPDESGSVGIPLPVIIDIPA
jgi:hypothetical protein